MLRVSSLHDLVVSWPILLNLFFPNTFGTSVMNHLRLWPFLIAGSQNKVSAHLSRIRPSSLCGYSGSLYISPSQIPSSSSSFQSWLINISSNTFLGFMLCASYVSTESTLLICVTSCKNAFSVGVWIQVGFEMTFFIVVNRQMKSWRQIT